jgi:hypothetical protein
VKREREKGLRGERDEEDDEANSKWHKANNKSKIESTFGGKSKISSISNAYRYPYSSFFFVFWLRGRFKTATATTTKKKQHANAGCSAC